MSIHPRDVRSANWRTAIAFLLVLGFAACINNGPRPLQAQTPPAAPPCPASSILLTAKPIKGVGTTTIKNACPAFLTALERWYAVHPLASVPDAVAAITGVPLTPPVVTPPPVVVQPPQPPVPPISSGSGIIYSDDFSSYTSTADFNKRFWVGTNRSWSASPSNPSIVWDSSEKAIRYDWPARPIAACMGAEMTVALMPRLYPPPPLTNLWVKFTSKESPNFEHGASACRNVAGLAYKYFLVSFESGPTNARFGTYLIGGSGTFFSTDMTDHVTTKQGGGFPLSNPWGGSYHTYVLEMLGIGTSNATLNVYLDGKLMPGSISASFLPGKSVGPGWAITLEMGANINNGPDHAQSRWFRELGVYTTRPSNLP